ncbi:VOC family protein [Flavitalea sp. BT771]|uniref:VOC family protein n=1 Tax=Flavitalea sp. BT771 TaxID=3063329 RepID=UPI0026E40B5A|nr:VOC family protein [Flavitalea sp. BT771]MDO6431117.1 VOC family protein [Flavitalea sp. BT771]MDV6220024.1 VOC family protein [Flavitalea sp. BT771]
MATVQRITPSFWFDWQAEAAAKFYTSIFPNSSIGRTSRYGKEGFEVHQMPEGTVLTIDFTLDGQKFSALNGGPLFNFNESISFIVSCKDQEELDYYWDKLKEGGDEKSQQCGWLKDKFGVSWQIVPSILAQLMDDPARSGRVMTALLKMKKLDIKALQEA